jgi:hypothetical protein
MKRIMYFDLLILIAATTSLLIEAFNFKYTHVLMERKFLSQRTTCIRKSSKYNFFRKKFEAFALFESLSQLFEAFTLWESILKNNFETLFNEFIGPRKDLICKLMISSYHFCRLVEEIAPYICFFIQLSFHNFKHRSICSGNFND